MNVESPTGSIQRLWVAVYRESVGRPRVEPPPTYDEAMGTAPAPGVPSPTPQPLLPSPTVPLQQVANEAPAWRPFSRPPHPLAQQRTLQKQLERRERTQKKLDAAHAHLERVLERHAALSASGRIYCGGGLFDDEECSAISMARHSVDHYVQKKIELQDAHAALLRRNRAGQS